MSGEQISDLIKCKIATDAEILKAKNTSEIKRSVSVFCFVAGTLIKAENGNVPIEDIRVGDYVLSCDPETGEIANL